MTKNRTITQGAAKARPSLAEIAAEPGSMVFVEIRDPKMTGKSFPAPKPVWGGVPIDEPVILQWTVTQLDPFWLTSGEFIEWYNENPGVCVWKTNKRPAQRNLELPAELQDRVGSSRRWLAIQIAQSEFLPQYRQVVEMNLHDVSADQNITFLRRDFGYFLLAVKHFEVMFQNRPEVIKLIDKRLAEIRTLKTTRETNKEKFGFDEHIDPNAPYSYMGLNTTSERYSD